MNIRIPTCILAGGLGTRLSERTGDRPKPMVEIGGRPMLWHIMKYYSSFGFYDFKVALGYRGDVIKDYFLKYHQMQSDLRIELNTGAVQVSKSQSEPWTVDLIETGFETMTGGRVRRFCEAVGQGEFFLTYGDGLSNVDLAKLLMFHRSHGKLVTVTAVRPPARFGAMIMDGQQVVSFQEKPQIGEGWINGGFFVVDARIAPYLTKDDMPFEQEPLATLAAAGELMAYQHTGFWHCMDTLRDVMSLDRMWQSGSAPWKIWDRVPSGEQHDSAATAVNVLE